MIREQSVQQGNRPRECLQDLLFELKHSLDLFDDLLNTMKLQRRPRRFRKTMLIKDALELHEDAASVFASHHLIRCSSCIVRFEESLEEAAQAYDIPLETWLWELNALLDPK